MWRQISKKSSRDALRRYASGQHKPSAPASSKPVTPVQPVAKNLKSEPSLLSKRVPEQKSSTGSAVYAVVLGTLTATGGLGYYIHENPQFNPSYLKENEGFKQFREFVLSTFPSSKAGLSTTAIVLADPTKSGKPKVDDVKKNEKIVLSKKKTTQVEQKQSTESKKSPAQEKKTEKKPVEKKEAEKEVKPVESAASTPENTSSKVHEVVAVVEQKVEEVAAKTDAAVKAGVAKIEAAVNSEAAKAATVLQKKLDDASAKEKAVIDALNQELITFEEKAKEASAATKNMVVKKARAESEALSEELDHTILAGIKELDAESLRLRVAQLATEMKNRTKWEAVRMMESLKRMEEEVHAQHAELLRQQDVLHKELLARELRLQEELITRNARQELDSLRQEHESQLKSLIAAEKALLQADFNKKLASFKSETDKKVESWLTQKADEIQTQSQKEQAGRIQELEEVRVQLKAVNELLGQTSNYEAFSHQVHKVSVAALALTNRIEAAAPLHNEIRALRAAGKGDHLIEAAIKTLSPYAEGAPSVAQLQERFKVVQIAARKAALVPENSNTMVGHLFANALHLFVIPPGGPIQGNDVEAIFSRADYALRGGDIESAVAEVDKLTGLPREVVSDWVSSAKSRLAVEQTAKVVKAHISLLAASLS